MNWTKISVIIGCVVGLFAIGGGVFQVDRYYAHAEEVRGLVKKLEYTNDRLEYKIKEDQLYAAKRRLWQLEDRSRETGIMNLAESRELIHQIEMLESTLTKRAK